jgi:hypothetical protein
MHRTGLDGVNIIRNWFTDPRNNWPPAKESTVLAGVNKKYKSKKKREQAKADYRAGAEGFKQLLVDTGQMRNAISYVVDVKE